ncbi:L-threonylcarbamoyladenylate synthase [Iamia majanohamensis]|uniref:L-threonylcarbamoyladenylate synthase n=1 Tax=Iamia majanohamensis TaxID=467976 RepID=A0AAF0BV55_9ACTN|nr:L-threonylcarbamoyladenylate synthase [Iamia majanohamensis]WCO66445.1 L-threonylcarbamoyladenylate synthase [Iamia majanohamensis]
MTDDAEPDPDLVARLATALRAGEAVVLPTDTVYGLAALPSVPGATGRIFALKGRRPEVPLAVLVADVDAARAIASPWTDALDRIAAVHWPGALTLVVGRGGGAASWDLGGDPRTIGVRCPGHPLVRAVAALVGPIATTSANAHGQPTPPTAAEAAASLTGPVAVVADGGTLDGVASTVVDATGAALVLRREGALTLAQVEAAAAEP